VSFLVLACMRCLHAVPGQLVNTSLCSTEYKLPPLLHSSTACCACCSVSGLPSQVVTSSTPGNSATPLTPFCLLATCCCSCSYQGCRCGRCCRSFEAKGQYLDLTLTSGVQQQVYEQKMWQGTELFR
jgi:hypothetical protein